MTARPASAAYGVDDLVVYETAGRQGMPRAVRIWSPRGDRPLARGEGATGSRLLGAGALDGRPVALVSEMTPGPDPSKPFEATEDLVAVDLLDGARTVYSEDLGAFEEGWTAAHLLPDGDVVAERYSSITASLVRLDSSDGEQWRTETSVDTANAFAAVGTRLTVVVNLPARRGARLRLDTYAPGDGARISRQRLRVAQGDPSPGRCQDWFDATRLACEGRRGPVLVEVPAGSGGSGGSEGSGSDGAGAIRVSAARIDGPAGAVVTAVATTG